VVTHSSGNHGAALALAARLRAIPCHVVAPDGALPSKLALIAEHGAVLHRCAPTLAARGARCAEIQAAAGAPLVPPSADARVIPCHVVAPDGALPSKPALTADHGAVLHRCAPTLAAREARCAEIQAATGAHLVHPYADPRVIAGQGTATLEPLAGAPALDVVVVPVGGGGLAAGAALALAGRAPGTALVLAEPAGAADAAHALRSGERDPGLVPDTLCDGLRASLGEPNFRILHAHG